MEARRKASTGFVISTIVIISLIIILIIVQNQYPGLFEKHSDSFGLIGPLIGALATIIAVRYSTYLSAQYSYEQKKLSIFPRFSLDWIDESELSEHPTDIETIQIPPVVYDSLEPKKSINPCIAMAYLRISNEGADNAIGARVFFNSDPDTGSGSNLLNFRKNSEKIFAVPLDFSRITLIDSVYRSLGCNVIYEDLIGTSYRQEMSIFYELKHKYIHDHLCLDYISVDSLPPVEKNKIPSFWQFSKSETFQKHRYKNLRKSLGYDDNLDINNVRKKNLLSKVKNIFTKKVNKAGPPSDL